MKRLLIFYLDQCEKLKLCQILVKLSIKTIEKGTFSIETFSILPHIPHLCSPALSECGTLKKI